MNYKMTIFTILLIIISTGLIADGTIPQGEGTEDNPYQIATLDNLLWLSTTQSAWGSEESLNYFVQTADINAYETRHWNDWLGFGPIGINEENPFMGYYDGHGYSISRLVIGRDEQNDIGFFGYMTKGKLSNVSLLNVEITGYNNVGTLVGSLVASSGNYAYIDNCTTTGNIEAGNCAGGLIGYAQSNVSAGLLITNCTTELELDIDFDECGGLIGSAYAFDNGYLKVENSHSAGSISFTHQSVNGFSLGGLIGKIQSYNTGNLFVLGASSSTDIQGWVLNGGFIGTAIAGNSVSSEDCLISIKNSHSTGNVNSSNYGHGGFIGKAESYSEMRISNCYSTGNIISGGVSGGFIGKARTYPVYTDDNFGNGTISIRKSYSLGNIDITSDVGGGFIGSADGEIHIFRCYSKGDVAGNSFMGGFLGRADAFWNSNSFTYTVNVNECYSVGNVDGTGEAVGGFIGGHSELDSDQEIGIVVNNCFWNTETSGQEESYLGTGKTTLEMQDINTYQEVGWSIAESSVADQYPLWVISSSENGGYPYINLNTFVGVFEDSYDFGFVNCNEQYELELAVGNYGNTFSMCSIETAAPFYLLKNGYELVDSLEFYIGQEEITTLVLVFAPTEPATYNTTIQISTDDNNNLTIPINLTGTATPADNDNDDVPLIGNELSNYPNPFNPETTIYFSNSLKGNVTLDVFNVKGQKIIRLVNEEFEAGKHSLIWNGKDDKGCSVASGLYFNKINANNYSKTKKMVLMK